MWMGIGFLALVCLGIPVAAFSFGIYGVYRFARMLRASFRGENET